MEEDCDDAGRILAIDPSWKITRRLPLTSHFLFSNVSEYAHKQILDIKVKSLIPFFRALADETRLRIVMLLLHGELCVCDLMAILDAPQSKLSRHLAYLKHSGIVGGRREGVWMHYSLRAPLNELYRDQIDLFRKKFSVLSPFREEKRKMLKFKANGVCRSLAAAKTHRSVRKQVQATKR